jgi:hypothetical protein
MNVTAFTARRRSRWCEAAVAVVISAGALTSCRARREPPAHDSDDTPLCTPSPGGKPVADPPPVPPAPAAAEPQSPFHDGPPVRAGDPTRVDPVELLPQARKVALGFDEHAVLTEIFATKSVTAGTVDVTGDDGVTFRFEWLYFDKSRPPGRDKVENGLSISARRGRFSVMELRRAPLLSRPRQHRPDPAPDPRCSARDAWKAAVRSGVPGNAVASMHYVGAFPGRPGLPHVWDFRVEGHDDLRRQVNGATCAIWDRSQRSPGRR